MFDFHKGIDHSAIRAGLSGERQRAVSGNALDHLAIGQALSGKRQRAVSDNAIGHLATGAGPQW